MSFTPEELQKIDTAASRWAESRWEKARRQRDGLIKHLKDRDDRVLYGVEGFDDKMGLFK
jgi:hypothetical protein